MITRDLIDRVSSTRAEEIPPDVTEIAKRCILDCLGVALAGCNEPAVRHLREAVAAAAGVDGTDDHGAFTVIGRPERLGLVDAAVVNGASCHALDFDDTQPDMEGHPTAPVLPALLALGELRRSSGADLLTAFVVGVECECLLGATLNPGHYDAGWHATATFGRLGAAAGGAYLCGLTPEATGRALGIAAVQAAGLKSSFGTMAKPFQVGKAAGDGAMSVLLAERGLTANQNVIEARDGFIDVFSDGLNESEPPKNEYLLRSVVYKFHAACHLLHPLIDALTEIGRENDLAPDQVERVELHLTDPVREGCPIDDPQTGLEAKFSAHGVAALVLSGYDTGDPATFADANLSTDDYRRLLARVEVVPVAGRSDWASEARIHCADGRVFSASADVGRPAHEVPAQSKPLLAKFKLLAEPVIGNEGAVRLREAIETMEEIDDVGEITSLCAPSA